MIEDYEKKYTNSTVFSTDIINYLIKKHNFTNYLEIGIWKGENFNKVICEHKDAVDPGVEGILSPCVNYPITSDNFFELIKDHNNIKYDLIFIDGLHECEQVYKDINNSLKHLTDDGFIILHDCSPISKLASTYPRPPQAHLWNGDVYRAFIRFKTLHPGFDMSVVDTHYGIGIIPNTTNNHQIKMENIKECEYEFFDLNRKEILNLISVDEFYEKY